MTSIPLGRPPGRPAITAPRGGLEEPRRPMARLRRCLAAALAVTFAVLLSATAPSGGAADAPEAVALLDGFEDPAWPDPNLWLLGASALPSWGTSDCRARTGARSLWAFGLDPDGAARACDAAAPAGSVSTIIQRLDLRAATLAHRLELHFALWMQLPPGGDTGLFIFLRVPQAGAPARRIPVFGATGDAATWVFPDRQLDLRNLADVTDPREVFDLRGGVWELEWQVVAPNGTAPGGGVSVDDVRLFWEPDAALPPPTVRPTGQARTPTPPATPSPTATAVPPTSIPSRTSTPTRTRTATAPVEHTPTPPRTSTVTVTSTGPGTPSATSDASSATPVAPPAAAYLPWVARELVLYTATPTATTPPPPTPPPTAPTPTSTPATAEPTPALTPTSSPTPTPPLKPGAYLPWLGLDAGAPGPTEAPTAVATGNAGKR